MAAELDCPVADLRLTRERIAAIALQVERHRSDREELLQAVQRIRERLAAEEGRDGSRPG